MESFTFTFLKVLWSDIRTCNSLNNKSVSILKKIFSIKIKIFNFILCFMQYLIDIKMEIYLYHILKFWSQRYYYFEILIRGRCKYSPKMIWKIVETLKFKLFRINLKLCTNNQFYNVCMNTLHDLNNNGIIFPKCIITVRPYSSCIRLSQWILLYERFI